jgi:hypothetical protein
MSIHRRLTAKNGLVLLLVSLTLALIYHLRAELWNPYPSPLASAPASPHSSDGGIQQHIIGSKKERRTAVVVASQKSENATWLDQYFPHWEKNIYRVDDSRAPLTVPKNKGRESMVYLT